MEVSDLKTGRIWKVLSCELVKNWK